MSTAAPAKQSAPTKSTGYDVARPQGRCFVSGEPINPGDKCKAALRETATGLERVDVLPAYWEQFDRKDVLAFWMTVMPRAEEKKKVFVDDTVLCELFDRLGAATEANKLSFRFVLGLILMRKRLLAYDGTRHEQTGDIWTVHLKGSETRLDLIDPKLNEQQMMDVSRQLGEILNEEL